MYSNDTWSPAMYVTESGNCIVQKTVSWDGIERFEIFAKHLEHVAPEKNDPDRRWTEALVWSHRTTRDNRSNAGCPFHDPADWTREFLSCLEYAERHAKEAVDSYLRHITNPKHADTWRFTDTTDNPLR